MNISQPKLRSKKFDDDDDDGNNNNNNNNNNNSELESGVNIQRWVTDNTNSVPLSGWLSFCKQNKSLKRNLLGGVDWSKQETKFLTHDAKTEIPTWPFPGPEGVFNSDQDDSRLKDEVK